MTIVSVHFRTFGPLLFRAPGEFTPTARGPQALAKSLPLPPPSTIAGCLTTAIGRRPPAQVTSWVEAVEKALNLSERSYLRGPYLVVNGKIYVGFGDKLVNLDNLSLLERIDPLEEFVKGQPLDNLLRAQSVKRTQRVGIGLVAGKVVDKERGLIYLAEMVDYESTFLTNDISIAIDAHNVNLGGVAGRLMRLGGEGKVTRIELVTKEELTLRKYVKRFLRSPSKSIYLFLTTFAFLERLPREPVSLARGVWFWPNLIEPVRKLIQDHVTDRIHVEYVIGEAMILGGGFDLLRGVKKPCYAALKPGAVIKVRVEGDPTRVVSILYKRSLSSLGGRLGYGTFIPVRAEASK